MKPTMNNRPKSGLVLQGGGARGAYQVGVIKALGEIAQTRRSPFQVITGASVGAINAAPLAASANDFKHGTQHLETLWRGLTCDSIYDTRAIAICMSSVKWLTTIAFGGLGIGDPCALLDNAPLGRLLEESFDQRGIELALKTGALDALAISASGYGDGSSTTFFQAGPDVDEWKRARRQGQKTTLNHRHLLASSALPFVFPAIGIDGRYYGDGALRLATPLSPAIQLGAERLVIIGVRDKTIDEPSSHAEKYPSIGEMVGHAIDIIFNDDLDMDIERLSRINRTIGMLDEDQQAELGLCNIETVVLQPSKDLREIALRHAHEIPNTIKLLFKSIGAWGRDGRLISYLLFEPPYIGELIDLGYGDTMDRRSELTAWLEKSNAYDASWAENQKIALSEIEAGDPMATKEAVRIN